MPHQLILSNKEQQVSSSFDIRDHIESLTPTATKNKYICPVCEGNDFSIEPESGKYQCFNNECKVEDIREAIKPWAEVLEERKQGKPNYRPNTAPKNPPRTPREPLPVPLPSGELIIATLTEIPTDIPQAVKPQFTPKSVRDTLLSKGVTEEELKGLTVTTYSYGDDKASHRYQAPCATNFKSYEKTFAISRVDKVGKTYWSKGDYAWAGYRQQEAVLAMQSVSDGKIPVLLSNEGEKSVESGRSVGLAGITSLGGAGLEDLVCILNDIKFQLGDRPFILAHCQDNDATGIQKAEKLAKASARCGVSFIAIDLKDIQPNLCDKGDIVDVLESGMTGEEIAELILEQIKYVRLDQEGQQDDPGGDNGVNGDDDTEFNLRVVTALFSEQPWISADNKLYRWDRTHYEYVPDSVILPRIHQYCKDFVVIKKQGGDYIATRPYANPAKKKEALEWVKGEFQVNPDLFNPSGLNCTNGILQILWDNDKPSWKLIDHSPSLYYTYRPRVKFDPEADPSHCNRLLECLEPAQREVFLRTISASLDLSGVRKYKGRGVKALLLKGDGSNGKDSFREAVSLMYGKQGITGCTLSDFAAYDTGRKFPLAKLATSRVNWASENANSVQLDKIQSLKAFITGDELYKERKGVDDEPFDPNGIALFNVNDVPTMQGSLEAIQSRYGIIEFKKTFKVGADPSKSDELEADSRFKYDQVFMQLMVIPAFLNKVLESLSNLMSQGIDYRCTQDILEDVQATNNHLFEFAQDTGLGYNSGAVTPVADIWTQLEAWYKENGTLAQDDNGRPLWIDQVRPSDKNVKAINHVIPRFLKLFPKAKKVMVPRPGGGKPVAALSGISFVSSPYSPFATTTPCNPRSEESNPNVTQLLTPQNPVVEPSVTHVTLTSTLVEIEKENHKEIFNNSMSDHIVEPNFENGVTWVTDSCTEPLVRVQTGVTLGLSESPSRVTEATIDNEPPLQPLEFNIKVGDRILCYPTQKHASHKWQVVGVVTLVESNNGWFLGCTIEYSDKRKGVASERIAGGNIGWLLSKV